MVMMPELGFTLLKKLERLTMRLMMIYGKHGKIYETLYKNYQLLWMCWLIYTFGRFSWYSIIKSSWWLYWQRTFCKRRRSCLRHYFRTPSWNWQMLQIHYMPKTTVLIKNLDKRRSLQCTSDKLWRWKWRKNQKILLEVPKYGNDIDEVDEFATNIYWTYIDEIQKYHNTRYGRGPINGGYGVSTSGISSNVPMGTVSGATQTEDTLILLQLKEVLQLKELDTNGPTAVLNSVNKLPTLMITGGQLLNQRNIRQNW